MNIFNFDFSIIEWIALGILFLSFLIQTLFYALIYRQPYIYEKKRMAKNNDSSLESLPPISVVIASKNDSENLEKNLPAILSQNYPEFEVIVVNSGSTDETDIVLKKFQQTESKLYQTYIPMGADLIKEKKLALLVGIKACKYNSIVLTEAYCKPLSENWLQSFGTKFHSGKDIILGYCSLNIPKHTTLRKFIMYDNLIHNTKLFSMAILKKPFMGIGRNLGITKKIFFDNNGFASMLAVEGGEDDLLINKLATSENTTVLLNSESFVTTDIVSNFKIWRLLKSKYLSTKKLYKGLGSYIFGWETFSKYIFYLFSIFTFIWGIFTIKYVLIFLPVLPFIIRYLYQYIIIRNNSKIFKSGNVMLELPYFDIFQPINNFRFRKYASKKNRKFKR